MPKPSSLVQSPNRKVAKSGPYKNNKLGLSVLEAKKFERNDIFNFQLVKTCLNIQLLDFGARRSNPVIKPPHLLTSNPKWLFFHSRSKAEIEPKWSVSGQPIRLSKVQGID